MACDDLVEMLTIHGDREPAGQKQRNSAEKKNAGDGARPSPASPGRMEGTVTCAPVKDL